MRSLSKNRIVASIITISFVGTSLLAPFTAQAEQAQKPMGGEFKQTDQKHDLIDIFSDPQMQKDAALITVSCMASAYLPKVIDTIAKGASGVVHSLKIWASGETIATQEATAVGPAGIAKQLTGDVLGDSSLEAAGASQAVSVPIAAIPISQVLLAINTSISGLHDTINASHIGTEAMSASKKGADTIADCMVYGAGQLLLKQLTQNTVNWIKGGFHGSPSFAVNTHEIFLDLADSVAGDLAREVRGISMCRFSANFQNDLANNIELSAKHIYKFNGATKCPFPETFNINSSDFYKGVNNFSWGAMEYALDDAGNPFGASLLAGKELALRSSEKADVRKQELSWSNGFTNMVDVNNCNYPDGYEVADGKMYHGASDAAIAEYSTNAVNAGMSAEDFQNNLSAVSAVTKITPQETRELQKTYCKTTTPGKMIGDKLTKVTNIDMDRLGAVDSLNKIIGALMERVTQDAAMGIFNFVSGDNARVQQNRITVQDKTIETITMEDYAIENAKKTLALAQKNLADAREISRGTPQETIYALEQAVVNARTVVDQVTSPERAIARQAELIAANAEVATALSAERGAQAQADAASKAYYDALSGTLSGGTYIQPDPATLANLKAVWDEADNAFVVARGKTANARQRLYDAQHPIW